MEKIGTITVSVFKCESDDKNNNDNNDNNNNVIFTIKVDNEDVLPVSYVIEDTLKLY